MPTLVAITSWPRVPRSVSQRPMIVSDSPPWLPGTQPEYTLAVSMKFPPSSTNRSSTANDASRSAVQPNTLPPRQIGETSRPDPPSARRRTQGSTHGSSVVNSSASRPTVRPGRPATSRTARRTPGMKLSRESESWRMVSVSPNPPRMTS